MFHYQLHKGCALPFAAPAFRAAKFAVCLLNKYETRLIIMELCYFSAIHPHFLFDFSSFFTRLVFSWMSLSCHSEFRCHTFDSCDERANAASSIKNCLWKCWFTTALLCSEKKQKYSTEIMNLWHSKKYPRTGFSKYQSLVYNRVNEFSSRSTWTHRMPLKWVQFQATAGQSLINDRMLWLYFPA